MFWAIVVLLIIGGLGASWYMKTLPGQYDALAQCLKDKGALFYGAFWCPHCQEQKKMFGNSAKLLPYVECSLADQKTQTPICIEKEIKSYPTWIFADGSKLTGEQQPKVLAEKTGCSMPE
ncbi:MAG: vitamin K epoxide reductase [Parcubacteria group bacterium Gr01-1014_8]|nr:MAG: vitamin K epoxide reductase [Parcubacteria group bacterium Gr01-1014_8]